MILANPNPTKGFTLVEVLVAIAIIVTSLVGLSTAWHGNEIRLRKSKINDQAAFLLEQKMVEMEIQYKDKPLSSIPEEEKGDFGKDFPNYRWEFNSQEFVMPDLSAIVYNQDENQGNQEMILMVMQQMSEYFSKSIKEATVTIYYKYKKKEIKFSASTYFVDYTQDVGLPSGLGGGG